MTVGEGIPGKAPSLLITEVETIYTERFEISNVSTSSVDMSGWRVFIYDAGSWPSPKVQFIFPSAAVCPGGGVFEVRDYGSYPGVYPTFYSGVGLVWSDLQLNNQVAVLLQDSAGNVVDFFCAVDAYPSLIASPSRVGAGGWSGPPISPNTNPALTYQRIGHSNHGSAADWVFAPNSVGTVNPGLASPFFAANSYSETFPSSLKLAGGEWSGQLVVHLPAANAFLRADDGLGHPGDSAALNIQAWPQLEVAVPHEAFKSHAGLVGQGEVRIHEVLSSNLLVSLSETSAPSKQVILPQNVTILAGASNAFFSVSNFDDGLLEGPQATAIYAGAPGFSPGVDWVTNYDSSDAALSVSVPSSVYESAGWLTTGRVISSGPVAADVVVHLSSSNPRKLAVQDSVFIPAGQNSAKFAFSGQDDPYIEGDQTASIVARVPGWIPGTNQIVIRDKENFYISFSVPPSVNAASGLWTNFGLIQIHGILLTNLTISLTCSAPTKILLPASVFIPAGQSSVGFDATIPADTLSDGDQTATITASADGFISGAGEVKVIDDEVASFSFTDLPNVVVSDSPFVATIAALNPSGSVVPSYSGRITLKATILIGHISLISNQIGPFTNGVWTGTITVAGEGNGGTLTVNDDAGHTGSTDSFDILKGRLWNLTTSDFAYDPLRRKLWAGVKGGSQSNGQSVVELDPIAGAVNSSVALGGNPGKLALSDDEQFLYVGLTDTGGVARIDLDRQAIDLRFGLDGRIAYEMAVPPGDPHSLLAWVSSDQGLALFRDGVKSSSIVAPDDNTDDPYQLIFFGSSTNFYSLSSRGFGLWAINITTNGPQFVRVLPTAFPNSIWQYHDSSPWLVYEGGLLFSRSGDFYDPEDLRHLGSYPTNGMVAANFQAGQVYFLNGATLSVYDLATFSSLGQIQLPNLANGATKLISCGAAGVALTTVDQVLLIQSSLFPSPAPTNLEVEQRTATGTAVLGQDFTYTLLVSNAGPLTATNVIAVDVLPTDCELVLATNSLGTCTETNGLVRCPMGGIGPGQSLETTVIIRPLTPGTIVNLAGVLGNGLNPAHGMSRQTNTAVFGTTIPPVTRIQVNSGGLAYDSLRKELWTGVARFGGAAENSVRALNLNNGLLEKVVYLPYPAGRPRVSANNRWLYVSQLQSLTEYPGRIGHISRIDLTTSALNLTFHPVSETDTNSQVKDMISVGAFPDDIVVSLLNDGGLAELALYQNATKIGHTMCCIGGGQLEVNPSIPHRLYMLGGGYGADSIIPFYVDSPIIGQLPGSVLIALPPTSPSTQIVRYGGGLLFSDLGMVADPEALTNVVLLPSVGSVATDPASGLVFYLVRKDAQWNLTAYDLHTLALKWTFAVPGVIGNARNLTGCGPGILAFSTDSDQLFVLNTASLPQVLYSDLILSQTSSAQSLSTNVPVTFVTTVLSAGPAPAMSVIIENHLPPDATIIGMSSSQGTISNFSNNISAQVGNLRVGEVATLQVVATLNRAGTMTNVPLVKQDSPDPDSSNNVAEAEIQFSTLSVSDLSIHQSAPEGPVIPGSNFVHILVVSNTGPDTATGVQLSDYLATGASIVSVAASQGTVEQTGSGSFTVSVGDLSRYGSAIITLVASPAGGGQFLNIASVTAEGYDPDYANNQSRIMRLVNDAKGQNLIEEIPVPATDIAYEPSNQWIVASTLASSGPYQNRVVGIDPLSLAAKFNVPVGNALGLVALSDDSRYAYLTITDTGGVARVDLPLKAVDTRFAINPPDIPPGQLIIEDLAVLPGSPHTVAVARGGYSDYSLDVALFDDGVQRPDVIGTPDHTLTYLRIGFPNNTNIYATQMAGFQVGVVTRTGLTNQGALLGEFGIEFTIGQGLVYLDTGDVFDPSTGALSNSFSANGPVVPDLANGRVYFLTGQSTLRAFDWATRSEIWSVSIAPLLSPLVDYHQRLISLGTNGVALRAVSGQVFLIRTPQLAHPSTDITIAQHLWTGSNYVGDSVVYQMTIQNRGPWKASDVVVSNPVPANLAFVSASSTSGACTFTNGTVVCGLGLMTNGATATVTVTATAISSGTVTNYALVGCAEDDVNPSNNSSSASANISALPQPTVSVADAVVSQAVGVGSVQFQFTLSSSSPRKVSVGYRTVDGSALAGKDYNAASGVVTFSPKQTSQTLTLPIVLAISSLDPQKQFYLNLTTVTNGTLNRTQATATILQRFFFSVSINGVSIENRGLDTNAVLSLTSTPGNPLPVTVNYQTVEGTASAWLDYAPRSGTLTFAPGTNNQVLEVPVFGNQAENAVKTFSVVLSDPFDAILGVAEATVTIFDDALLGPLFISAAQAQAGNVSIQFRSIAGRLYRLERTDNLNPLSWTTVVDRVPGNGSVATVVDNTIGAKAERFYRLVLLP